VTPHIAAPAPKPAIQNPERARISGDARARVILSASDGSLVGRAAGFEIPKDFGME